MESNGASLARSMLVTFISGRDRSLSFANQLEGCLLEAFPSDPTVEELIGLLAQYSPGGGDYLYDEDDAARMCQYVLAYLDSATPAARQGES